MAHFGISKSMRAKFPDEWLHAEVKFQYYFE